MSVADKIVSAIFDHAIEEALDLVNNAKETELEDIISAVHPSQGPLAVIVLSIAKSRLEASRERKRREEFEVALEAALAENAALQAKLDKAEVEAKIRSLHEKHGTTYGSDGPP